MALNNSDLFNKLLSLKKQGYAYITSADTEDSTSYDQAVQDFYEDGTGNEPSIGDWMIEYNNHFTLYVTFYDYLLNFGETASRDYETELYEILEGTFPKTDLTCAEEGELFAYGVWVLGFKDEKQRINSIQDLEDLDLDWDSNLFEHNHDFYFQHYVNPDLWKDETFMKSICSDNYLKKMDRDSKSPHWNVDNPLWFMEFIPLEYISKNNNLFLNMLSQNPSVFSYLSENQKGNKDFAMAAVNYSGNLLHCSDLLKADKEVVLTAIKNNPNALQYAAVELKANKDLVIIAVSLDGNVLKYASDELKDDKEVVKVAMKNNPKAYSYASNVLRDDKELAMIAISFDGNTLRTVSDLLKADKEVIMAAVSNDGNALEYASDSLKANKEVLMAAISNDGLSAYSYCIKYSLKEFNPDKEMVMTIVSKTGDALKHASDEWKADKEVVMAAVSNDGNALEYASDLLKANKEVVMAAISNDGLYSSSYCIKYTLKEFNPDKEMVMTIVAKIGGALKHASDEWKADKEMVMAAVSSEGEAIEYASDLLKADKGVVMTAITSCKYASHKENVLSFASDHLKCDIELLYAAYFTEKENYNQDEHSHRFACWTAATAVRRGNKNWNNAKIKEVIEKSKLRYILFLKQKINYSLYSKTHEAICNMIINEFGEKYFCSFGQAAKIVAIYLKTTLMGNQDHPLSKIMHPPIDSVLLKNLSKVSEEFKDFQNKTWTAFDVREYNEVLNKIRVWSDNNQTDLWEVEKYWSPVDI